MALALDGQLPFRNRTKKNDRYRQKTCINEPFECHQSQSKINFRGDGTAPYRVLEGRTQIPARPDGWKLAMTDRVGECIAAATVGNTASSTRNKPRRAAPARGRCQSGCSLDLAKMGIARQASVAFAVKPLATRNEFGREVAKGSHRSTKESQSQPKKREKAPTHRAM